MLVIRQENVNDYEQVYNVVESAFEKLPEHQRKGIGTMLIKEGHKIAKQLNYNYSIVLGSNKYYSRLGYTSASKYNIKAPFEIEDECFMAIKLNENAKTISGVVEYDEAFGI